MRKLWLLAAFLASLTGAAAQTNVNFGLQTGSEPRMLGVYDTSHTLVPIGPLNSALHTFNGSLVGIGTMANGSFTGNNVWTPAGPAWSSFVTLYQSNIFNLGGLPASAMNQNGIGATGLAQALVGAIDVPSGVTTSTFQNNGVAGYARTASSTASAIGVLGSGMSNTSGTAVWGMNATATNATEAGPATQTGLDGVTVVGLQAAPNIMLLSGGGTPAGHARGITVFGNSETRTSDQYGLEIGPFSQTAPSTVYWDAGIVVDEAYNTAGILIGAKGSGNTSLTSQSLAFQSWNGSSAALTAYVYGDTSGNLNFLPSSGASGQSIFTGEVVAASADVINTTQFTGFTLSNGSHFAALLDGYGSGNDGGTLSLQSGGVLKTLLSGNPGTGSYVNNGGGLTVGGTGTAGAGIVNAVSGFQINGTGWGPANITSAINTALPSATTSQLYGGTGTAGAATPVNLSGLLPSATTGQLYGGTGTAGAATPVNLSGMGETLSTLSPTLRGYIGGLTLSNDGTTPNTVIDVTTGAATSADNTTYLALGSAFTKSIASTWTVGTGNGGLDTGSVAASTWYHVYVIERTDTGVVDVLLSLSATSPTLPTNYTKRRRVGSILTDGSSHILTFYQYGDTFLWMAPIGDFTTTTLGSAGATYTLSVPSGVTVTALMVGSFSHANAFTKLLIYSPLTGAQTPNSPLGNVTAQTEVAANTIGFSASVLTANSTINAVSSANSTSVFETTTGWLDTRGRWD